MTLHVKTPLTTSIACQKTTLNTRPRKQPVQLPSEVELPALPHGPAEEPDHAPSPFAQFPYDLCRAILELSARDSVFFDRRHIANLLLLSREVNEWTSAIAYHTIILNDNKIDRFVAFARSRGANYMRPRVKVLALTGTKLSVSALRDIEDLIRTTLDGLESFHYSCLLSPFIFSSGGPGSSFTIVPTPTLQYLSVAWRLLAAQSPQTIVQLAGIAGLTHLHLHFEATDLAPPTTRLRSVLAQFASVTHLALDRYNEDLLKWLHTDEMAHVTKVAAFVVSAPSTALVLEDKFPKVSFHKISHLYGYAQWLSREIGFRDFFA
ncbi:hypothetical protein MKEN_00803900 [Mycena kentingensis (nom. inval.)]|nr:hypothetical protein MKEN_00803900 [Mycena kentingensis (nom. inval.)]